MWEHCRDLVEKEGGTVLMESPVVAIHHDGGRASGVSLAHAGATRFEPADHIISSMPMHHLVAALDPQPPAGVQAAGRDLHYRDYLTVALVVPEARSFPDNWIYIHAPDVSVGRIQNYGSWSPYMVKEGRTCLGLEYFVFEGDELWETADADLIALASRELEQLELGKATDVEAGYVVRVPKAYPYYDFEYRRNVDTICRWIDVHAPNLHPVGRNGMHKYNNQDHSMYTAMLTVENMFGATNDIWSVNVEEEYHETSLGGTGSTGGTGRDAPVLPWPPRHGHHDSD
jgi:protoporphyrinogen oxidase